MEFRAHRRYVRIPVNIPVTLVLDPEGRRVKYTSYLVDIAEGGVKLWVTVSLAVGEVVDVIPTEGSQFTVRGRVVWTGAPGSEQESQIGLEFVKPVPTESWRVAPEPPKPK